MDITAVSQFLVRRWGRPHSREQNSQPQGRKVFLPWQKKSSPARCPQHDHGQNDGGLRQIIEILKQKARRPCASESFPQNGSIPRRGFKVISQLAAMNSTPAAVITAASENPLHRDAGLSCPPPPRQTAALRRAALCTRPSPAHQTAAGQRPVDTVLPERGRRRPVNRAFRQNHHDLQRQREKHQNSSPTHSHPFFRVIS